MPDQLAIRLGARLLRANRLRANLYRGCVVRWILGSRSPRRLELLKSFDPQGDIRRVPPRSPDEMEFEGLHHWDEIVERSLLIAQAKYEDVWEQVAQENLENTLILCGDTTVLCETEPGSWLAIGQPPVDDPQHQVLRNWLGQFLANRTHRVLSSCVLRLTSGELRQGSIVTNVTFRPDVEQWLDWYVSLNESAGRAGGYAIQGVGSIFVDKIEGSLSNVIGLPLELIAEWTACRR
jgi:septum formation protein